MASKAPTAFPKTQPPTDLGAGLSNRAEQTKPPQPLKPQYSQASRAASLAAYFLSGSIAINASQILGSPLYFVNREWYNAWIAFTKQSWGLLTMTMTQWWAPTIVRVSGDSTMRGQLIQTTDGGLLCNFPERMFLIANHQIYTDWLYLWWIGYAAGMHGRIYVVLKESLKSIPVIGWGMQFAQFIFLKRKWEEDKPNLARHMQRFNNTDPMWLMMFPEGTNLASCTREKSRQWAQSNGLQDMQHTLLPRSTGLLFMLKELRESVDFVYDCTIAYEGVPRGQYAQDIFTVGASYFGGRPPKSVNMYWRRFRVANIPLDDPKRFEVWLRGRWREKDKFIEHYYRTGRFPADRGSTKDPHGKTLSGAGHIEAEVKPKRWYEFLQVFAPIGLFALVLYFFYGALPPDMVKKIASVDQKTVMKHIDGIQKGEIRLPETKDIMATVPAQLQNRFDAVRKIAEARGTSPEKVIAQLQALSKEDNSKVNGELPKLPNSQGGTQAHVSAPAKSREFQSTNVQTLPNRPSTMAMNKMINKKQTMAPKPLPNSKSRASLEKVGLKNPQKVPPQPAKDVPKPKVSSTLRAKSPPVQKTPVSAKNGSNTAANPTAKDRRDEEVRKARKKMEIRQGKQVRMRKTRRTVEASLANK